MDKSLEISRQNNMSLVANDFNNFRDAFKTLSTSMMELFSKIVSS